MPINHDDEFHGPINQGNRYPDDWFFINSNGEHETVDVAKTLEANKGLLEHPFYN